MHLDDIVNFIFDLVGSKYSADIQTSWKSGVPARQLDECRTTWVSRWTSETQPPRPRLNAYYPIGGINKAWVQAGTRVNADEGLKPKPIPSYWAERVIIASVS